MEFVKFNDGHQMPILGYGTYQTPPTVTAENVEKALAVGYRSIDTAQNYRNEAGVGQAVQSSNIDRDKLFITSKAQTDGYEVTKSGIDESLQRFGGDYFDLMIIHWPQPNSLETYRALEDAQKEGKIKSIGVSNFNSKQLDNLIANSIVKPVIDQIETHVFWQQKKMHEYLTKHDIVHESWGPLGENLGGQMMNLPEVKTIAKKYNVSPAQVLLRFLSQEKIVIIPKSTNIDHIKSNFDIFGFKLTADELESLEALDRKEAINGWPSAMRESAY
jgi:diketogulonate reductase-like aldo/keto reductase